MKRLLKKTVVDSVEDMRGLFMIVKGQYNSTAPQVKCEDGQNRFIGGYDPSNKDTKEWYQLMDRVHYITIACSSDLNVLLKRVYANIVLYKNDKLEYLKTHQVIVSYEDDGGKKTKRSTVSPLTVMLMKEIEKEYGDYFNDVIEDMENKAVRELSGKCDKGVSSTSPTMSRKSIKPLKTSATPPKALKPVKKTIEEPTEEEFPFISEYETKVIDGKRKTVSTRPKKVLKKKVTPEPLDIDIEDIELDIE